MPDQAIKLLHVFHERYRILKVIGKGGMGTVYLADDLRLKGKQWAIKEIKLTQDNYQQFIDEAKMLISLKHSYLPNIVDYYPPNEIGYSYLVMDYIAGSNLSDLFDNYNKVMPLQKVLKYSLQICDLLDYLHNKQQAPIIYRDLKPSNIMIDEQDNVRLIDFGIARSYKKGKKEDTVQMGTVGFAAPEQFENKQTDHRADIYSLGAVLYYLLSQGHLYHSSQKPLNYFRKDLSHDLIWIIRRMLMTDPNERYQNIKEVKKELEYLLEDIFNDSTEEISFKTFSLQEKTLSSNSYSLLTPKLIVVANLSKRAGSTFISLNLAKYLTDLNILTSILEIPFEPYIFDNIGLQHRLSKGVADEKFNFYSYPHAICNGDKVERGKGVVDEGIIWMVADPRNNIIAEENWSYLHMMKYIYSSKKASVTILDVGNYIEHPSVEPVLEEADLILVIIDPMPAEIMMNSQKLTKLLSVKKAASNYEFVVNRFTKGVDKKELMDVLQFEPLAYIPAIDLNLIHKSAYDCRIPYSFPEVKAILDNPFYNIISKLLPEQLFNQKNNRLKKNFFIRWSLRSD